MASVIVLVTGANSGVGFGISKVLVCASESYHVIMAGRSVAKVEAAAHEITASGIKGTLSTLELDVTDESSIAAATEHVRARHGCLHVLVNNAGVGGLGMEDVGERYRRCLETNVTGPALVSEAFRPLLLASPDPYSIFVGSGARTLVRNAMQRPPHMQNLAGYGAVGAAYQVSKAALNMLAVLEARDFGPRLKAFVLSPGCVRSNLRGTSEEQRSADGLAVDPEIPGQLALDIIQGRRDGDVGKLVHKDGVFDW